MDTQAIKKIIEDLVGKMSSAVFSVELVEGEDGIMRFAIKTTEPEALIGRDGMTLLALNHLVRKMADKNLGETETNFIIDVNDYQKRKVEELKQKVKMMAERARFFKSSVELEPMSSYERMIVHSYISLFPDVITESVGMGPGRHIVIRYKEQNIN